MFCTLPGHFKIFLHACHLLVLFVVKLYIYFTKPCDLFGFREKPSLPKTNKRFLHNTLVSGDRHNARLNQARNRRSEFESSSSRRKTPDRPDSRHARQSHSSTIYRKQTRSPNRFDVSRNRSKQRSRSPRERKQFPREHKICFRERTRSPRDRTRSSRERTKSPSQEHRSKRERKK